MIDEYYDKYFFITNNSHYTSNSIIFYNKISCKACNKGIKTR